MRDKKAFYGSEDVTETLLAFQKQFATNTNNLSIGKYTWHFGETIIKSVGCIKHNSYLSQWLAIYLT